MNIGNFKYFNAIYHNCKNLPKNIIIWLAIIFFYIFTINISFIKFTPLFYPLPLIFLYLRKKNILSSNIFIFIAGIIEDIIFCRILGISSLFYLLLFNIISIFLYSTKKLIYYTGQITLIFLYYIYQIISLIFLRDKFYIEILQAKEIFYYQLIALSLSFLILSLLWIRDNNKRD